MKYAIVTLCALALAVTFIAVPQPAYASTSIFGDVSSDTVWHAGEVYVIYGVISINSGVILTIEPGAIVKFNYGASLLVRGELKADGTSGNQIYFTSIRDDSVGGDTNGGGAYPLPVIGDWGHLWIVPGGNLNLEHSIVRFGGGYWPHYSNIAISGGTLSVSNSTISSAGSIGLRMYGGSVNISDSSIINNVYGILKEGGTLSVSNSAIYGNSEYGMFNGTLSQIDAENNWWGHASGPYNLSNNASGQGNRASNFIDFDPWLTAPPVFEEEEPPLTREPVLIIPGIAGTELYNGDDLVWANLSKMFYDPDRPFDTSDLFLTENLVLNGDGELINNSIKTRNTIEKILGGVPIININIFEGLRLRLLDSGYNLDEDLFFFPYDWRLDLNNTAASLSLEIERIKLQTGHDKVNIVAHSMGGLLTKEYIRQSGKDSINKLIFVGTPHLGAPKAGKVLIKGDDFGIPWLEESRIKEIAENSIALHELLPSQKYFNLAGPYIKEVFQLFPNEVSDILDYDETRQFLFSMGSSQGVFESAENHFDHNLENIDLTGIDAYNIAGCKISTQGGYQVYPDGYISSIKYRAGDKTVPFVSGNAISLPDENKFYSLEGSHAELPSRPGVRDLIADILSGQDLGTYEKVTSNVSSCGIRGKETIWKSPVEVHIYDSLGRHTGPIENEGIEYGIPGVDYEISNHDKFVFLPTDDSQSYRIAAHGLDSGTFDLIIRDNEDGVTANEIIFNDVPVTTLTDVEFNIIPDGVVESIGVDRNGDGLVDAEYLSDGTWISYNTTIQSTLDDLDRIFSLGWSDGEIKHSLESLLMAILPTNTATQSRGKKADGVLGTAFLKQLEGEYNKGSINQQAYDILKKDIEWLLR